MQNKNATAYTSRLMTGAKLSLMAAPFALVNASAATDPALAAMTTDAQAGVDAIKAGVVGLVGVILVIALIIWGSHKLKPSGK